jgi:hypothetical protein
MAASVRLADHEAARELHVLARLKDTELHQPVVFNARPAAYRPLRQDVGRHAAW